MLWLRTALADGRKRMLPSRRGLAVAALSSLTVLGAWNQAKGQRNDPPPHITVAATIIAEIAAQTPLLIQVGPPEALPANSFVQVRGLPPSVSLTEGHLIAPGSWAVPLYGLPTLKANVPAGVAGRREITISLVAVDGRVIAEAKTALVVATLPPAEKTSTQAAPKGPAAAPAPAARPSSSPQTLALAPDDRARAVRYITQGDKYLASGNIAAARDFYERAAEVGLAEAAIRLAATYDPAELKHFPVQGIVADRAAARKWYERARELGAPEAVERLARLGGS
jgi:hypothetical protein